MADLDPARARFETLFRAHYRDVLRFAARRIDRASAEDIANETFTICWRRLGTVPDDALPWLYAVARNVLANHQRAAIRASAKLARAAGERPPPARDPAERLAEQDAVLRALAALPERDREVLRLVAWEGLSQIDAARVAGTNRVTFAARLHRARRRLTARLEEESAQPRAMETTP